MKTNAAIVGIGESRVGKVLDRSALQLQADAAQAADRATSNRSLSCVRLSGNWDLSINTG